MKFWAHIAHQEGQPSRYQSVEQHCINTGTLARDALPYLPNCGYLAGILHDMGKGTCAFSTYLIDVTAGRPRRRGEVNHTFAGVRFILTQWHTPDASPVQRLTAELLAFAVGSHHGLFDCFDGKQMSGFNHRLASEIQYEESIDYFLTHCTNQNTLDDYFQKAMVEIQSQWNHLHTICHTPPTDFVFYFSVIARLLASAVMHGDREDTAAFMENRPIQFQSIPLWADYLLPLQSNLNQLAQSASATPINLARQHFSDQVVSCTQYPPGIYPLPIPTGGGKTLAALRFALEHAKETKKRRIFFVIPLLSILEQNAAEIKFFLGDTVPVLEHHSNLVQEHGSAECLHHREFLQESWSAPIIITTLVQLLNTLFAGKTSCVRRMQGLQDSIIVIDEAQTIPTHMLSMVHLTLNYLSAQCGATILLSTATQPCSEQTIYPLHIQLNKSLVDYDPTIWDVFRRTNIIVLCRPEGYTLRQLADFMQQQGNEHGSALLICNTKRQARAVAQHLTTLGATQVFHLSTAMCPAHRTAVIDQMKQALLTLNHPPIYCVSTQLMEAGVDISFGCAIRVEAGMDSIIQTAGRCNRHGEFGALCPVYIVNIQNESLSASLQDIQRAQNATRSLLAQFEANPAYFNGNLTSAAAITYYYQAFYKESASNHQDFYIQQERATMLDMLSMNIACKAPNQITENYMLHCRPKTAGAYFTVFDTNTTDILVPYGEGANIIAELHSQKALYDISYQRSILHRAKHYAVSLYEHQIKKLTKENAIIPVGDGGDILALAPTFYRKDIGVITNPFEIELDLMEV